MKTIFNIPMVSQPTTQLSEDTAAALGLPQFLHGGLVPDKNVNLTEGNPPESTAKNETETAENQRPAAKTSLGRAGRPKAQIDVKLAFQMQKEGKTMREIQQTLGCGLRTLERALSKHKKFRKGWDF